jgi:hypothetical protein
VARKSKLAKQARGDVVTKSFAIKGGLNLVDTPMVIPPGMLLDSTNYELLPRQGVRRVDGFERFDGQASPSEQSYWVMNFDNGDDTSNPPIDSIVEGGTSGARAKIALVTLLSGSWAGGTAAGEMILFTLFGVFQDNETLMFIRDTDGFNGGFSNGFG